jgi:alkanesulfonate monooxygenase SsuD/methylene tetrahydromethanopterin reductase-like flavin-dependent oxidoreductase (luciferase family)
MKIWYFTEQSYHPAWAEVKGPLRIDIPSSIMPTETVSGLLNRYLDEYMLADEMGLDLMINEHHQSLTCMSSINIVTMSILARQTKKARLLSLGVPMGNRQDPLRVAEELAMVDNISGGRVEFGFVKGTPWELFMSNSNPAGMMDRFWEAHDVVLKAFATRDGPFSWEGEHFNYRHVNVMPPIMQYPHPPMWLPGSGADTAKEAAKRDYTLSSMMTGTVAKNTFAAYRKEYQAVHGRPAKADRLAYFCMMVVADNHEEARRRAEKLYAYSIATPRSPAHTFNPPGYSSIEANAHAILSKSQAISGVGGADPHAGGTFMDGRPIPANPTMEMLPEAGKMFWGTPDEVVKQLTKFNDFVGGLGNFLCMTQGGYMGPVETADSIRLIAKEVAPQVAHLGDNVEPAVEAAE